MTHPHSPWIDTPARLGLVVLTVLVLAGLCPLVFFVNQIIPPGVLRVSGAIALGLAAGFTSRFFLADRSYLLRLLSAVNAAIVGLYLINRLTAGYAGLALQLHWSGYPDWAGLGQWLLSSVSAWLVLQAKLKPKSLPKKSLPGSKQQIPVQQSRSTKRSSSRRTLEQARSTGLHLTSLTNLAQSLRKWSLTSLALLKKWHNSSSDALKNLSHQASLWALRLRDVVQPGRKTSRHPVRLHHNASRKKGITKSQTSIRLVGKPENRCPYCLEIVEKNDPRGVKICPICRTYHHADCWAVTGACQVPHHHE